MLSPICGMGWTVEPRSASYRIWPWEPTEAGTVRCDHGRDQDACAGELGAEKRKKVIRANYAAFNNGDIDGVLENLHPEIELLGADEDGQLNRERDLARA